MQIRISCLTLDGSTGFSRKNFSLSSCYFWFALSWKWRLIFLWCKNVNKLEARWHYHDNDGSNSAQGTLEVSRKIRNKCDVFHSASEDQLSVKKRTFRIFKLAAGYLHYTCTFSPRIVTSVRTQNGADESFQLLRASNALIHNIYKFLFLVTVFEEGWRERFGVRRRILRKWRWN